MACFTGSNIVNDGLVFAYDMDNDKKSWKGKPSTNLTTDTPSQHGWAGTYTVLDSNTKTFLIQTTQITAPSSAWRTWCWDVSSYIGQTVTISGNVEFISETNASFLHITIGQGNTGSFPLHIAGSDSVDRVTIPIKPIEKLYMTWTGVINATGIIGFTQWINNVTANNGNSILRISNVQIEVNDFATLFVNGTRSDTQAILDLTKNNTITAANLTYLQDGTPTFDGTDDFLVTGTPDLRNSSYSISAWVKPSSISRFNPIVGDLQFDWFGLYFNSSNQLIARHRRNTGEDNQVSYGMSSILTSNTWYYINIVFDITTGMRLYVNKEQVASNNNTWELTILSPPRGPQYIGRHSRGFPESTDHFAGDINQVKIYNRALTAIEVTQNFEATRARFEI